MVKRFHDMVQPVFGNCLMKFSLAGEMIEEGALGQAGRLEDVIDGSADETSLQDHWFSDLENPFAGSFTLGRHIASFQNRPVCK